MKIPTRIVTVEIVAALVRSPAGPCAAEIWRLDQLAKKYRRIHERALARRRDECRGQLGLPV